MNKTDMTGDGIGQRIHDAGERLGELKDDVAQNMGRGVKTLGVVMKEHPLVALAAGVGIGYLIARLVHR